MLDFQRTNYLNNFLIKNLITWILNVFFNDVKEDPTDVTRKNYNNFSKLKNYVKI